MSDKVPGKQSRELSQETDYQELLGQISAIYTTGQRQATQAVNTFLTETYWQIGQYIVEFEQGGDIRARYGKALLKNLSQDLTWRHGRGFSRSNLVYMRLFYLRYPKREKPSDLLSWSHYVELLKIDDPLERGFYEQQTMLERRSFHSLMAVQKTVVIPSKIRN